jgi:hypothetical protein
MGSPFAMNASRTAASEWIFASGVGLVVMGYCCLQLGRWKEMFMGQYRMKIHPAGTFATVIQLGPDNTLINSDGPDDYVCGSCGHLLMRGVGGSMTIRAAAIRCPCGADNEADVHDGRPGPSATQNISN